MDNTEYAVYYVSANGEFDRSPINIFDNYDDALSFSNICWNNMPDGDDGDFVVVEH